MRGWGWDWGGTYETWEGWDWVRLGRGGGGTGEVSIRERGGYWRGGRGVGIGEEGEGWVLERRERGGYWRGGRGVGIGEEGEG